MNCGSRLAGRGWLLVAGFLLCGCVQPDAIDQGVVAAYQRAMVARGPGARAGYGELDMLRPLEDGVTGELPVEPIEKQAVIETIRRYEARETDEDRKPVKVITTVKTTTFTRTDDGELTSRTETETSDVIIPMTEVPEPSRTVRVVRVGAASETRSLLPGARTMVHLSLRDAILRAVSNSLDIRVVSFDPAISYEDMIQAAAEFDTVVFGEFNYAKSDRQSNTTFQPTVTKNKTWGAGLRGKTLTGATWETGWSATRTWEEPGSVFNAFNKWWEPELTFELTQPLLRDAWTEVNLAQLRIARIDHGVSLSEFRGRVEEVVTQAISSYWALWRARRDWRIQRTLLDNTVETRNRVMSRMRIDASEVELKQAEASVATRRAALIRARKTILDVQDALARLLGDDQVNLLEPYELVLDTPPSTAPVDLDATDQLLSALTHSPLLEQARLGIAGAGISVTVAENQLLPRLDLQLSGGLQGLDRAKHEAYENLGTGNYASYFFGLLFEYPLGNRAARSALRQAKTRRLQAITALQNTADQIAVAVKERLRQIATTWEEIEANRQAVAAAARQLEALNVEERRVKLSPEFLNTKLRAQETLAGAQRAALQAVMDYNTAQIELAETTGTVLRQQEVEVVLPRVIGGPVGVRPVPRAPASRRPSAAPATRPTEREMETISPE